LDRSSAADAHGQSGATVLFLTWFAALNISAPVAAAGPLMPLLIADLGLAATAAATLTALPSLVRSALSIPGGSIADRWGPRRALAGSLVLIALAGAARGIVPTVPALLISSTVLGIAASIAQPALGHIARAYPRRVAAVTAVYTAGLNMGVLAAAVLSATLFLRLAGASSWRGVFVEWGIVALLAAAGWRVVRSVPPIARIAETTTRGALGSMPGIPGFAALCLAFTIQTAMFNAWLTWLPAYYVDRGDTLARASAPLVMLSLGSLTTGFAAPRLAAGRHGYRWPVLLAGVVIAAGQLGLLLLPSTGLIWAYVIGAGTGIALTVSLAAVAQLAPSDRVGRSIGTMLTIGFLGAVAGPMIIGASRDITGGYRAGMLILLGLAVVLAAAARYSPAAPPALTPEGT
jgi:CP family cyanate transporter-like MFS transporter